MDLNELKRALDNINIHSPYAEWLNRMLLETVIELVEKVNTLETELAKISINYRRM